MNIEILKNLIDEGEHVLATKFIKDEGARYRSIDAYGNRHEGPRIKNVYVNSDLFIKWYEKVKIFLVQHKFEESIVKPNTLLKNYDIAKTQLAKLKGILELNEIDSRQISNNSLKDFNIFIGHGHHLLWARIALFLLEEHNIKSEYYESKCRTGLSIDNAIEEFKQNEKIKFAILTLMKEDETSEGQVRARQNVIHELGIFRDKLGSKKIAIIVEKGLEKPSNIDGIEYIEYSGDIDSVFYKLEKMLKREKLI